PVRAGESQDIVDKKFHLVSRFVDILIARRIWNFRATDYSTMQYAMFLVMRDIRGLGIQELAEALHRQLAATPETFDSNPELSVHQQNRGQLHKLLARITDYVTTESGGAPCYVELTNGSGVRYEVEHVWANQPKRHLDEFTH